MWYTTFHNGQNSGNPIFQYQPQEEQWWITGFSPLGAGQTIQANDLEVTVSIDFSNNENLYVGFYEQYGENPSPWEFDGKVATLTWQ